MLKHPITLSMCIMMLSSITALHAQRVVAAGGEANGNTGTISYSIGLPDFMTFNTNGGSVSLGIQHPYETFELTGVTHISGSGAINVFPNPTSGQLSVAIEQPLHGSTYTVYDMHGRTVMQGIFTSLQSNLDMSVLSEGAYLLTISESQDTIKTLRIIKTK